MQRVASGLASIAVIVLACMGPTAALAEHTIKTTTTIYYPNSRWNGVRVFLSSPRHSDSGGRLSNGNLRECRNPGWEENINGRFWNFWAANTNYYGEQYDPENEYRNLRSRGYKVAIGRNDGKPPKEGAKENRELSNNWEAHVHLVTHTNAHANGCPANPRYLLLMYKPGDGRGSAFGDRLVERLDPVAPGGKQKGPEDLIELGANARTRAYTELHFHTDQFSQAWFTEDNGRGTQSRAWRYGWAIDKILDYPRAK